MSQKIKTSFGYDKRKICVMLQISCTVWSQVSVSTCAFLPSTTLASCSRWRLKRTRYIQWILCNNSSYMGTLVCDNPIHNVQFDLDHSKPYHYYSSTYIL